MAPGLTVNGALSPGASASPLVRLAVSTTPLSAFVYVTPLIVTWLAPAVIVPVRVPPNVPVPDFKVRATPVAVATFSGAPSYPWPARRPHSLRRRSDWRHH